MKVAFSGAGSTGKTTIINMLKEHPNFQTGWEFAPSITRSVKKKYRVDINEDGDDDTQLSLINEHFERYRECQVNNIFLDRCIFDVSVYTEYLVQQGRVSPWVLQYCMNIYSKIMADIDMVFYTSPVGIENEDDGERSTDDQFRLDIVKIFEERINNGFLRDTIIPLVGDPQERLDIAVSAIEAHAS